MKKILQYSLYTLMTCSFMEANAADIPQPGTQSAPGQAVAGQDEIAKLQQWLPIVAQQYITFIQNGGQNAVSAEVIYDTVMKMNALPKEVSNSLLNSVFAGGYFHPLWRAIDTLSIFSKQHTIHTCAYMDGEHMVTLLKAQNKLDEFKRTYGKAKMYIGSRSFGISGEDIQDANIWLNAGLVDALELYLRSLGGFPLRSKGETYFKELALEGQNLLSIRLCGERVNCEPVCISKDIIEGLKKLGSLQELHLDTAYLEEADELFDFIKNHKVKKLDFKHVSKDGEEEEFARSFKKSEVQEFSCELISDEDGVLLEMLLDNFPDTLQSLTIDLEHYDAQDKKDALINTLLLKLEGKLEGKQLQHLTVRLDEYCTIDIFNKVSRICPQGVVTVDTLSFSDKELENISQSPPLLQNFLPNCNAKHFKYRPQGKANLEPCKKIMSYLPASLERFDLDFSNADNDDAQFKQTCNDAFEIVVELINRCPNLFRIRNDIDFPYKNNDILSNKFSDVLYSRIRWYDALVLPIEREVSICDLYNGESYFGSHLDRPIQDRISKAAYYHAPRVWNGHDTWHEKYAWNDSNLGKFLSILVEFREQCIEIARSTGKPDLAKTFQTVFFENLRDLTQVIASANANSNAIGNYLWNNKSDAQQSVYIALIQGNPALLIKTCNNLLMGEQWKKFSTAATDACDELPSWELKFKIALGDLFARLPDDIKTQLIAKKQEFEQRSSKLVTQMHDDLKKDFSERLAKCKQLRGELATAILPYLGNCIMVSGNVPQVVQQLYAQILQAQK